MTQGKATDRGLDHGHSPAGLKSVSAWSLLRLVLAVVGLNLFLALENLWPTPWPRPALALAVETVAVVLLVALLIEWRGAVSSRAVKLLAAVVLILVLCRYAQVTMAGLFGRPPDLYWDFRQIPGLLRMLGGLLPLWQMTLLTLASVVALVALYSVIRMLVSLLAYGLAMNAPRRALTAMAAAVLLLAVFVKAVSILPTTSISDEIARQAALTWRYATQPTPIPPLANGPLPNLESSQGARPDVFVIFWESYGAILEDQPAFAPAISRQRARLESVLDAGGWSAASGLVRSPTFGGGSWFAHASLLSGRTIGGEAPYRAFLEIQPETLLDRLGDAGYRRIALMPGLKGPWPEGRKLGFDAVYDDAALDYAGPDFGWWRIPDQVSLERLYRRELKPNERAPIFVLFPSIMSHIPFAPSPPYRDDWDRVLEAGAFELKAGGPSAAPSLKWPNLAAGYQTAVAYNVDWLAGLLESRTPSNAVLLVLGDHQPPSILSGPNARWSVPIHVISRDPETLKPFLEAGFQDGLKPPAEELSEMAVLAPLLLEALNN